MRDQTITRPSGTEEVPQAEELAGGAGLVLGRAPGAADGWPGRLAQHPAAGAKAARPLGGARGAEPCGGGCRSARRPARAAYSGAGSGRGDPAEGSREMFGLGMELAEA